MPLLEGLWFWAADLVVLIAVGWFVFWDRGVGALLTLAIGAFAIWYLSGAVNILPWLLSNWATIIFAAFAYVIIGGLWAIINWRLFFLPDIYEEYQQRLPGWKKTWESSSLEYKASHPFKDYVRSYGYPPLISEHKADFFMWMWWWFIHAPITIAHKPIERLSRWFYEVMAETLNRWSSNYFTSRSDELK